MQRKATKNTRGPNAEEKAFQAYTKECDCIVCGRPGPSIVDHVMGATFKHLKTLIGHWLVIPLCMTCDRVKTHKGKAVFRRSFGNFTPYWTKHMMNSRFTPPDEVIIAIDDWGR